MERLSADQLLPLLICIHTGLISVVRCFALFSAHAGDAAAPAAYTDALAVRQVRLTVESIADYRSV